MVAEDQPTCAICGVPLIWHQGEPLHVQDGRLNRMLRLPYPHVATTELPNLERPWS